MSTGTRQLFTAWLGMHKKLTYSAYARLDVKAKAAFYSAYQKSRRKGGSTDGDKEETRQEG